MENSNQAKVFNSEFMSYLGKLTKKGDWKAFKEEIKKRWEKAKEKGIVAILFFFFLLPLSTEAKTRYVITIKETRSAVSDSSVIPTGSGRRPAFGSKAAGVSSNTPQKDNSIRLDFRNVSTGDSLVDQIPNVTEREFVATLPHGEQVANIYKHESNFGRNDVCRTRGMANGFGFGEMGQGANCYSSFEAIAIQINQWLEMRKHLGSAMMTCLYIRGIQTANCVTNYKFL